VNFVVIVNIFLFLLNNIISANSVKEMKITHNNISNTLYNIVAS